MKPDTGAMRRRHCFTEELRLHSLSEALLVLAAEVKHV